MTKNNNTDSKPENLEAVRAWLSDPYHHEAETSKVTVADLVAYLKKIWIEHLKNIRQLALKDKLHITIRSPKKHAADRQMFSDPNTNLMFDITALTNYSDVFHDFTVVARLPYYLLHYKTEGKIFASFNPHQMDNLTTCQAMDVARFGMLADHAFEGVLSEDVLLEYFDVAGLLHYPFVHTMNEPLPMWHDPVNELTGPVSDPQRDI